MRFLKRAFTLIEIAVVLVIISILISMVAGFLPKIIETFKLKRAISYVQDNLDYLKAAITREGILSKENLPHYLAHKVDIWGRPFYYKVPDNLADKSICVASHTNLYVCIVKDFEKFTEEIKNYNPKNYNYFSCKNIGGDLVETAVVLLSSGKNGNIQTPILILDDNECESQDTCYVVPYLKNVPPAALVDYYLKVNSNYIISSDEEKWILATNPSLLADKDISSNMEYDDIVSYLPLDIAKSNCPSKQVIGNIERFWVEPQDPKVNENVTFHWIATLSGVGINLDKVRCILDFGDGNLETYSGFNKCLGYQKRNHKYKKAGIFTPILKIYDDQGNLILVKTTNVYVKGASGGCTVDNFKAFVLDNGTFKEIADASTQDAYANVTVPATIKYTWNITYNSCPNEDKSCFISFGDGTTQKFNDCSSIKEVIHTYQYSGDYVAKLFVACGCE
ncbi:MAG TPA: prepilin-type N-terminal cleavage/methylation domain-containing protein, partial [Aquificae bacterium]|nr:prepilin-type N-terminal cleavage/methylation domain-containing protein [Aquificota bacterium]